jgi:hypothetical protein
MKDGEYLNLAAPLFASHKKILLHKVIYTDTMFAIQYIGIPIQSNLFIRRWFVFTFQSTMDHNLSLFLHSNLQWTIIWAVSFIFNINIPKHINLHSNFKNYICCLWFLITNAVFFDTHIICLTFRTQFSWVCCYVVMLFRTWNHFTNGALTEFPDTNLPF